jgi:YidC/Oxa1 family membrane protein insertase
MTNRNTIIGLILIFGIFLGYTYMMTPSKEEMAAKQRSADSLNMVYRAKRDSAIRAQARLAAMENLARKDSAIATGKPIDSTTVKKLQMKQELGAFALAASGTEKHFTISNEVFKLKISNKGGHIDYANLVDYKSWTKEPLLLINPDDFRFGYSFFSANRLISTDNLYFQPYWYGKTFEGKDSLYVSGNDSIQFAMRLYPSLTDTTFNPSKYMEIVYTIHGKDYMMGYKINFVGMADVMDPSTKYIVLNWHENLVRQEKSVKMERMSTTIYYKYYEEKVDYLSETKDQEKLLKNEKIKWVSFKQQFFSTTLIAGEWFSEPKLQTQTLAGGEDYLKTMSAEIGIPFNPADSKPVSMSIYMGPNKYYTLKKYDQDLQKQIPLGWGFFLLAWINIYAVIPVFTFFGNLGWNYGIIILILTILLKIVLFPIAAKTYKSSAKMRVLKPEIDELNAKYPKKEDALKKQQATMDLYKRAGVNPMAGCIPLLLQMPILIAMFRFFPSSIELRQQAFLWAKDLSSYDSIWTFPNGFSLPWYGNHVSLFALLMTISSIFYTKINENMMGSTNQQMPGMKTMMYLMPVMFLFWFNDYSSGLSYYYLLANLLTFAQIYIIKSTIDEKKLHAQIEANKKKPVKKSSFQKRLENMAKQRGYPVKK